VFVYNLECLGLELVGIEICQIRSELVFLGNSKTLRNQLWIRMCLRQKGFVMLLKKKVIFLKTSFASLKKVVFELVGQKGLVEENTDFSKKLTKDFRGREIGI
jgi:hypothetical protein